MFTKVQKKTGKLWNCFSENHEMLFEREGAEYMNAVPDFKPKTFHLIWGRLFIMKEKSYMVTGNHYLREEDDIFCTFYYEFWYTWKVEISSRKVKMRLYRAAAQRALSSSFRCSGWGPCCAMRGPCFHLPHIKQMFPSVKTAVRWQLASRWRFWGESLSLKPWQVWATHHRAEAICLLSLFLPSLSPRAPVAVTGHHGLGGSHTDIHFSWFGGRKPQIKGQTPGEPASCFSDDRLLVFLLRVRVSSHPRLLSEGTDLSPRCPTHVPGSPADTPIQDTRTAVQCIWERDRHLVLILFLTVLPFLQPQNRLQNGII